MNGMTLTREQVLLVREAMKRKGVTRKAVAAHIGVHYTSLNGIIYGKRRLRDDYARSVYDLLERPEELAFLCDASNYSFLDRGRQAWAVSGHSMANAVSGSSRGMRVREDVPAFWTVLFRQQVKRLYQCFENEELLKPDMLRQVFRVVEDYDFDGLYKHAARNLYDAFCTKDDAGKLAILSGLERIMQEFERH